MVLTVGGVMILTVGGAMVTSFGISGSVSVSSSRRRMTGSGSSMWGFISDTIIALRLEIRTKYLKHPLGELGKSCENYPSPYTLKTQV